MVVCLAIILWRELWRLIAKTRKPFVYTANINLYVLLWCLGGRNTHWFILCVRTDKKRGTRKVSRKRKSGVLSSRDIRGSTNWVKSRCESRARAVKTVTPFVHAFPAWFRSPCLPLPKTYGRPLVRKRYRNSCVRVYAKHYIVPVRFCWVVTRYTPIIKYHVSPRTVVSSPRNIDLRSRYLRDVDFFYPSYPTPNLPLCLVRDSRRTRFRRRTKRDKTNNIDVSNRALFQTVS